MLSLYEHVVHLIIIIINLIPLLFNQLKLSARRVSIAHFLQKKMCEQMNVYDAIFDFHARESLYVRKHEHNSQLNSKQHTYCHTLTYMCLADSIDINIRPGLHMTVRVSAHTHTSLSVLYITYFCCFFASFFSIWRVLYEIDCQVSSVVRLMWCI